MDLEPSGHRISPQDLSALLRQHVRGLEVYAAQWSLNPEDCVQEAFVKLAVQSPPPDNCIAWLFQVTRNFAISSRRSSQRRTNHESVFAAWVSRSASRDIDPGSELESGEEQKQMLRALESLGEEERELVVMRIWSELTWAEIGELINTSRSSAQRKFVAVIEKIRSQWETSCLTKPN
jgi:RNA polymerase sigma-70 factor (ECF subfamily)